METDKNSKLEKYSDKVLFTILTEIDKEIDGGFDISLEDSNFSEVSDNVCTMLGVGGLNWLDVDFLITLYRDNANQISEGKLDSPLSRPKVSKYYADVDVVSTEYIRRTYRHTTRSYSEENVIPQFRSMEDGGDISVWDGHEIDYDTFDSTTDDIKWDITSVTQVK